MHKWVSVAILALFLLLVLFGIGRQFMQNRWRNTAVPTLAPTAGPALLPAIPTAVTVPTPTAVRPSPVPTSPPPAADIPAATASPTGPPPPQPPAMLNGIPLEAILVLPAEVQQNVRVIFAQGQALGRNPHAYSKVGDSTIQNPYFMARFDAPDGYNLGEFAYLQPAIAYFAGSHGREGVAVRKGLHAWTVTDPMWADKSVCLANESPIACEIRLHNPALLIIRLGSNDAGVPEMFEQNVRLVIELALANGVIPVIGTKADRFEGSNINNEILRRLAAEYQLPLWDFDQAAQMIPGRGLDVDQVHLTTYHAHDYSSPLWSQRGHSVHNLTALMMLDALRQIFIDEQETTE